MFSCIDAARPAGRVARTLRPTTLLLVLLTAAAFPGLAPRALHGQESPPLVTPAEQRDVIERAIALLRERYVFTETAERLADSLRADLAGGRHAAPAEPGAFADELSGRLREVSRDGHLWVVHDPAPAADAAGRPAPEDPAARRLRLSRSNFGLPRAEVLPGNIGYLDIRQFADPGLGGDAAAAAMSFLGGAEALILDVRQSAGGSPRMVQLLASHVFAPEPVHLFDIHHRPDDRTEQYWSLPHLAAPRVAEVPVYVLTRASTFSAGEGLAYVLKHLGRATVVGETTAGGANPGAFHRLNERFAMFVAEARVTSPATGTNWEGVGVAPDVEVEADRALERAHRLALEALRRTAADPERARELDALIGRPLPDRRSLP